MQRFRTQAKEFKEYMTRKNIFQAQAFHIPMQFHDVQIEHGT
jgi:hypothetical protein